MSSLAPVDIIEEDAADLQFPKDFDEHFSEGIINVTADENTKHSIKRFRHSKLQIENGNTINDPIFFTKCDGCSNARVQEPYINCAECSQIFCLSCFASGRETNRHRNTHSYIIRDDNVEIFKNTSWTANEEKQLLELIVKHGFGNWERISSSMNPQKTQAECQKHYLDNYFDGICGRLINGLTKNPYYPECIPFMYKMNSVEPPRLAYDSISSMGGYRAARSDFDVPYDNSAESMISHLELNQMGMGFNIDENKNECYLNSELNSAMFMAYNNRLRERHRRYQIMRDHGLLMTSRTLSWLSKHSEALGLDQTTGKFGSTGRFISFMQLTNGIAFDLLVESMQYAHDLKKYIFRLYELRQNGISTFTGGRTFHRLRARRLSKIKDKRADQYETQWEWKHLINDTGGPAASVIGSGGNCNGINIVGGSGGGVGNSAGGALNNSMALANFIMNTAQVPIKRKSTPLDILGLPGYDKLTDDERQLCSTVRLGPLAYIAFKKTLIDENAKTGYLRLADARRIIKIDVNKTRQLYDFLLKNGFINNKPF